MSLGSAPPAIQQHITAVEGLRERSVNPRTGVVDYLVPNMRSEVFKDEKVRLALAAATNRDAYVTAIGGATAADPPARSRPPACPRPDDADPVGTGTAATPPAPRPCSRRLGRPAPVPFTVAYRSTPTADKAMAALVAGWRLAGFEPTARPITDDYFTAISDPELAGEVDVFWSNWAPAWASASTILPPLFDSRSTSPRPAGTRLRLLERPRAQHPHGQGPDDRRPHRPREGLGRDRPVAAARGAYIGLAERRALYIAGSDVRNLSANTVNGGVVEFADIAVVQ